MRKLPKYEYLVTSDQREIFVKIDKKKEFVNEK